MANDVLLSKRCAFGSKHITGQIDLMILRGSTNDGIIQPVIEDFFDNIFYIESSIEGTEKEKELKDFKIVGWAGGDSILRLLIDAKGSTNLLTALEEEWSKLAFRLARKLDQSMRFNPDRAHRFQY